MRAYEHLHDAATRGERIQTMTKTIVTETVASLEASISAHGGPLDRVSAAGILAPEGWEGVLLDSATPESATFIAREAITDGVARLGVTAEEAQSYWDGSQTRGRVRLLVPTEERIRLAEDLARWARRDAEASHDADVASSPDGRHYTYCCEHAREDGARNEYAFAVRLPIEQLRRRHADVAMAAGAHAKNDPTLEALLR